jgi:hypothetical protein
MKNYKITEEKWFSVALDISYQTLTQVVEHMQEVQENFTHSVGYLCGVH